MQFIQIQIQIRLVDLCIIAKWSYAEARDCLGARQSTEVCLKVAQCNYKLLFFRNIVVHKLWSTAEEFSFTEHLISWEKDFFWRTKGWGNFTSNVIFYAISCGSSLPGLVPDYLTFNRIYWHSMGFAVHLICLNKYKNYSFGIILG